MRRRRIVLGTTALFAVAALIYGFLATPLYTATSQLLIDPRDRQVITNDLNAGVVAPDGGITKIESQVRVIESDTVLLRAIAEAGLAADPEFGGLRDGLLSRSLRALREVVSGPQAQTHNGKSQALRNLRRKLAVKRAEKVFVVDVIVTASDPDKAALIVNAIARAYLADQAEARADAAKRASGELNARLDSLRRDVLAAETRLESFRAENGLIASSGRLVGEQQLTDSNARLVAARNRTAEAKSRLQGIRSARGSAFDAGATPEAIQAPTIERLRTQFAELTSKEADLRTQLGERHPFITAVRTQKADVKRLIDAELGRIVQGAEIEYQRALANERSLAGNLDSLKAESVQTGKSNVRLRELERDLDASRSVYNTFLVRSREISEQANVDATNARVITWAQPPEERSWPLRLLILGAAMGGGLGIGAGLALVREYARPTLLSRRQLERLLDAPVLATFPETFGMPDGACAAPAAFALDSLYALAGVKPGKNRALNVLVTAPASEAAERRSLIDLLAAVATARGDHVLVVEAELSSAHPGTGGLLEVLRGEISFFSASVTDTATGARRLAVGNGQKPVRDAFERENVQQFLAHVAERYDLVLIDGGTLTENVRIAPLVGAVDRVVVVASGGRTLQDDLVETGRIAAALGRPPSGALFIDGKGAAR
ncbi:polysaccharide biosynthesis tyrosine autokinase [Methylobacterium planeticum]|uniref:Polysaccharide biosynthesis tyrosine autokinase n=2 Tax=Methylobacterium planeticum TaxID=2615211 RepID=A0A6N6MR44_9HYPH|nr:polysaccharide biosynthesis tyrosine autokinase [Methylobacterium planeticum]